MPAHIFASLIFRRTFAKFFLRAFRHAAKNFTRICEKSDSQICAPSLYPHTLESSSKNGGDILWQNWQSYDKVTLNDKVYAKVGDRLYSKHAVDRMQPSGNRFGHSIIQADGDYGRSISPEYVDFVIGSTEPEYQPKTGNYLHSSGSVEVVVNSEGAVVTIMTYK